MNICDFSAHPNMAEHCRGIIRMFHTTKNGSNKHASNLLKNKNMDIRK